MRLQGSLSHSLSLSLSFPTRLSKHNTTFPPSKRVHESSLNNEQKNNFPPGPPTHGLHSPYGNHSEPSLLPYFLDPFDMACVCKLAANSIWQTHLIWWHFLCPTEHITWPISFVMEARLVKTTLFEGGAMATPLPLKMGLGYPWCYLTQHKKHSLQ
jgi:hypothetical protein